MLNCFLMHTSVSARQHFSCRHLLAAAERTFSEEQRLFLEYCTLLNNQLCCSSIKNVNLHDDG